MSQGKFILQLITSYLSFTEQSGKNNLSEFSEWYLKQNELNERKINNSQSDSDRLETLMRAGKQLGQLINYTDVWTKLAFADLPIRQFEDLAILREIHRREKPAKSELAKLLVNEKSTIFERIKSLVRKGLLFEEKDLNDKRINRVILTREGFETLKTAEKQAQKVAELLFKKLSDEEVFIFKELLKKMNNFHDLIYDGQNYHKIDDLL